MNKRTVAASSLVVVLAAGAAVLGFQLFSEREPDGEQALGAVITPAKADPPSSPSPAASTTESKSLDELVAKYGELPLIDSHNHDAASYANLSKLPLLDYQGIDKLVLFGDVSEPSAVYTDLAAWEAYKRNPDRIIPFFSGVNLLDESGWETARNNLEKGYFGIGELAAASTNSPVLANVAWKTQHPMDGILPDMYKLAAEYDVPLLLHIDPPSGYPMDKLEEALRAYPETTIIFAHANAYSTPDRVRRLLADHPNLYADFFAGFTAFNPGSSHQLEDYVPVMKEFPDRFVLSTDSGYGLEGGYQKAVEAMYLMLDVLGDGELVRKIAGANMQALIDRQMATETQLEQIRKLDEAAGVKRDWSKLTKAEAGNILIEAGKA